MQLDQIADAYVREQYAGQRPTTWELRLVRSVVRLRRPRGEGEAGEDE